MADDRIYHNGEDGEDEEEDEIVELINDDGEREVYEHMATFPFRDRIFWAVTEAGQDPEAEEVEVRLLEVVTDEKGEDLLQVPDEDIYDEAFEEFLRLAEEEEE